MTLLGRFVEQRAVYASDFWGQWANGDVDLPSSGSSSPEGSLRLSAVYACVRLISEDIASLPIHRYESDGEARTQLPALDLFVRPNSRMTRVTFFEQMLTSALLHGAFYGQVLATDVHGFPSVVEPMHPSVIQTVRSTRNGLQFDVIGSDGTVSVLTDRQVMYMPAMTLPGSVKGLAPLTLARVTMNLSEHAEDYGARFFQNGAHLSGVIEVPGDLDPDKTSRLAKMWAKKHSGANQHMPGVLTNGATWNQISVPPEDAQFLETRKFQVEEVARLFRVKPHKIGDLDNATYSNIEQQSIEHVTDTLRPWITRVEAMLDQWLPDGQFVKFNVEGLLRGDTESRFSAYNTAISVGFMSRDEVRALEDLPPIADGVGAGYLRPLNMTEAGDAGLSLAEKVSALGALVRAGFDPEAATAAVGLDPIAHAGLTPTTMLEDD